MPTRKKNIISNRIKNKVKKNRLNKKRKSKKNKRNKKNRYSKKKRGGHLTYERAKYNVQPGPRNSQSGSENWNPYPNYGHMSSLTFFQEHYDFDPESDTRERGISPGRVIPRSPTWEGSGSHFISQSARSPGSSPSVSPGRNPPTLRLPSPNQSRGRSPERSFRFPSRGRSPSRSPSRIPRRRSLSRGPRNFELLGERGRPSNTRLMSPGEGPPSPSGQYLNLRNMYHSPPPIHRRSNSRI